MEEEKKMTQLELFPNPAHIACQHCGNPVWFEDSLPVTKHLANGESITLRFCGEACANDFYLERMRASEGQWKKVV